MSVSSPKSNKQNKFIEDKESLLDKSNIKSPNKQREEERQIFRNSTALRSISSTLGDDSRGKKCFFSDLKRYIHF
jgi:hypothetical protein